jgi:phosphatidate cytidylyltransferase
VKTRIVVALICIPFVLAAVFFAGPAPFGAIVLALSLLSLHEYLRLCDVEPLIMAAVLSCMAPVLIAVPAGGAAEVGAAAMLVLALLSLWRVKDPARRFRGLAEGVLGLCYIGYAMRCLWLLRMETAHGSAWLFLVLGATWAGDSAAFFVGSRYGRRRFCPDLSPNKTWAGAVGGLAGSLAGGLLSVPLFAGEVSAAFIAGTSFAVGLSGQLGDLFESLWKRAKGVKDSGNLIPGHGGILDRIDSLLIGIPIGYHIVRTWGP